MYTELDHNLWAPVQYKETSTQEGKQRLGWRRILNSICTEKPRSKAFKQQSSGSQKQRTACLIFRGGRYNEHSEINEIGQEYDKQDGKDNTRARQCKLHKNTSWPEGNCSPDLWNTPQKWRWSLPTNNRLGNSYLKSLFISVVQSPAISFGGIPEQGGVGMRKSYIGSQLFIQRLSDPPPPPLLLNKVCFVHIWYVLITWFFEYNIIYNIIICHIITHIIIYVTLCDIWLSNIKYSKIVSKAYTFSSSRGFWMVLIWPIWAKISQNLDVKNKFSASGTGPPPYLGCGIRVPTPPCPWDISASQNPPLGVGDRGFASSPNKT
jgi:hypothetical protein